MDVVKHPEYKKRRALCHPHKKFYNFGLCKACYSKSRRADCHPDRLYRAKGLCGPCYSRKKVHGYTLKKAYGFSIKKFNRLFSKQKRCCAICRRKWKEGSRRFYVDHNHKTKKVRGIICHHCNVIIGMAKDNVKILRNAIKYLKGSL